MFFLHPNDAVFAAHFVKPKMPRQSKRGSISLVNPRNDFTVQTPHAAKIPAKD